MEIRRWAVFIVILALAAVGAAQDGNRDRLEADLRVWGNVMEMFIMDDGRYPEFSSIETLAQEVYQRQYWEEPITTDPSGRSYQVISSRSHFRIWTVDNTASIENGFKLPEIKAEPKPPAPPPTLSFPAPRSPDTALYVTKSGNDIRLDWSGTGTQYDGALGTDPRFSYVRTLFTDSTAASYLFANGLLKYDETFLCFDVTDEVEVNHGGYWNGGVLPPPPPTIDAGSPSTTIGSLYDGSTGTIVGTGFSTTVADNYICFDGGVCTQATTATATQVQFITPPGAVSGDITVQVGPRVSDPATGFVTLEDPAIGWTIRSIGYAPLTADYWMSGNGPNGQSLYRMYYDTGTKKWLKEHRSSLAAQLLYCSTQTTRNGYYYCGYGTNSTGGGGSRKVDTDDPSSMLTGGVNLGGSGVNSNVRGAAADPNPDGVGGRDVGYFAHAISGSNLFYIKKVDETSATVLDSNYGNYNWSPNWGAIVGLAVDPVNGDLYVGTLTNISKIDTSENITAVKGGFTAIYGLDIFRQSPGDPGFLIIADAGTLGAGSLKAIALDNLSASPITVASVSNMRTANWGGVVFSQAQPAPGTAIRKVIVHNNSNSGPVLPVRPDPFVAFSPSHSADLWISAPPPEGGALAGPAAQYYLRASDSVGTEHSLGRLYSWYRDGKARYTCAYSGDPGKAAVGYEPDPADPVQCDKPRDKAIGECDNKDPLVNGGVGSFWDGYTLGNRKYCQTCGSDANKCLWTFAITKRYGGDDYKIYLQTDDSPSRDFFASASPPYRSVKHIHVENDRMCRKGGLIYKSYGAPGECDGGGQPACCGQGAELPCNQIMLYNWANVAATDNIAIFDETHPYEASTKEVRTILLVTDNGDGTSTVTLDSALGHSYYASDRTLIAPILPTFANGHSAGVCLNSANNADFYIADPTARRDAFDDAFVDFHVPAYGTEGASVVPYLPPEMGEMCDEGGDCANPILSCPSNHPIAIAWRLFGRIWFSRKDSQENIVQSIGIGRAGQFLNCTKCGAEARPEPAFWGMAYRWSEATGAADDPRTKLILTAVQGIEDYCNGGLTPNALQGTFNHEMGHQFYTSASKADQHDTRCSWPSAPFPPTCPAVDPGTCNVAGSVQACVMNPKGERWTILLRFDADDLLCGDPDCPNGNIGCCAACAIPGNGSIRQCFDPIFP